MQILAIAACLDLLMVVLPGPTSKEATILPPPANRVPCNPLMTWMGFVPPTLSTGTVDPQIESKVKNAKLKRFPRFRIVVDNPIQFADRDNIVVIVAGDPREREIWAESARTHFGQAAFIFNNLFSIQDLAGTLSRFPEGSVGLLAFGGHGEFCDGGVFMGIKDPPEKGRLLDRPAYHVFGEHINVENLMSSANKTNRANIIRSLAKGAQVEFHVCIVGQERNLLNFAEAFQRRCWANPGDVGDWGDGQYPWFCKDPPKRK
jgi:hypothetical protein